MQEIEIKMQIIDNKDEVNCSSSFFVSGWILEEEKTTPFFARISFGLTGSKNQIEPLAARYFLSSYKYYIDMIYLKELGGATIFCRIKINDGWRTQSCIWSI